MPPRPRRLRRVAPTTVLRMMWAWATCTPVATVDHGKRAVITASRFVRAWEMEDRPSLVTNEMQPARSKAKLPRNTSQRLAARGFPIEGVSNSNGLLRVTPEDSLVRAVVACHFPVSRSSTAWTWRDEPAVNQENNPQSRHQTKQNNNGLYTLHQNTCLGIHFREQSLVFAYVSLTCR